jgi:hypothetical protein
LGNELDDGADRIDTAPGGTGDRERRGEVTALVADEMVADARHRVDVREIGGAELRVLGDCGGRRSR